MFTPDPSDALAVQLGRPFDAWWETYYQTPTGRPDHLLRAEVHAFVEQVRARSREVLGYGVRAEHVGTLISGAGMLASDMADLDRVIREVADWYDLYSPLAVRRDVSRDVRALKARIATSKRTGRTMPGFLRRWFLRQRPAGGLPWLTMRPGARPVRIGTSRAIVSVSSSSRLQLGVQIGNGVWIISQIDDRDDRRPRETPEPLPDPVLTA